MYTYVCDCQIEEIAAEKATIAKTNVPFLAAEHVPHHVTRYPRIYIYIYVHVILLYNTEHLHLFYVPYPVLVWASLLFFSLLWCV